MWGPVCPWGSVVILCSGHIDKFTNHALLALPSLFSAFMCMRFELGLQGCGHIPTLGLGFTVTFASALSNAMLCESRLLG